MGRFVNMNEKSYMNPRRIFSKKLGENEIKQKERKKKKKGGGGGW